jgi:hypothetical protein
MTIFLFASCARKIAFQSSTIVPGAEGTVKVKKDNNSNYTIQVELSNLAEPGKLEPAMKTYVIWMETEQEPVKNIGQINSSSSFLSKRLKALLKRCLQLNQPGYSLLPRMTELFNIRYANFTTTSF